VIYLSTIFASVELEMETSELILVILLLQILAIVGALIFARVSDWLGNRNSLLIQIAIWMFICVGAYFVANKFQFFFIAGAAGLVLGGIQSLSRATYAKLIENGGERLTSYFSFYDILMKISLVAGAFLFGLAEQLTGNMRYSVLAMIAVFAIGMLLMWSVNSRRLQGAD
jgi:UMF1 family MFS transporter